MLSTWFQAAAAQTLDSHVTLGGNTGQGHQLGPWQQQDPDMVPRSCMGHEYQHGLRLQEQAPHICMASGSSITVHVHQHGLQRKLRPQTLTWCSVSTVYSPLTPSFPLLIKFAGSGIGNYSESLTVSLFTHANTHCQE